MKYESFKPLPDQLADKYKKRFIDGTKHIYYEPNPSFTEEELDKIILDFIRLKDILWHGLPDQIAKLINEEFGDDCLQTEVFPAEKVGSEILDLCNEGLFNRKGEKQMGWDEIVKKLLGKKLPMVNIGREVHKNLILEGKPIGDPDCVYLDDFLLVVRECLKKGGFSLSKISKEDIITDLCMKWNKDSKEVLELLKNIKLFQDLTGNLSGGQGKSITIKANKSDVLVIEDSKNGKL
ncbi:MAG: hypothetical protein KAT05_04010 [Spirochaetes bacterium]|nr:hypothetical protein [Spirochaetota bacterium]